MDRDVYSLLENLILPASKLDKNMDNFEETVVNPNICLKDIDGQLQRVSRTKQRKNNQSVEEQGSSTKSVNGYLLFAATTIIILLITIAARG